LAFGRSNFPGLTVQNSVGYKDEHMRYSDSSETVKM